MGNQPGDCPLWRKVYRRWFGLAAAVFVDDRSEPFTTRLLVETNAVAVFEHHVERQRHLVLFREPTSRSHEPSARADYTGLDYTMSVDE